MTMLSPNMLTLATEGMVSFGALMEFSRPGVPPEGSVAADQLMVPAQGLKGSICSNDQPPLRLSASWYQLSLNDTSDTMVSSSAMSLRLAPALAMEKPEKPQVFPKGLSSCSASVLQRIR